MFLTCFEFEPILWSTLVPDYWDRLIVGALSNSPCCPCLEWSRRYAATRKRKYSGDVLKDTCEESRCEIRVVSVRQPNGLRMSDRSTCPPPRPELKEQPMRTKLMNCSGKI